jgi:hypothetical protein
MCNVYMELDLVLNWAKGYWIWTIVSKLDLQGFKMKRIRFKFAPEKSPILKKNQNHDWKFS